jgi:5-methylcytosine-specific restriction protein A
MNKKRPDPKWKMLREVLWSRCDGFCEVSGRALDFETFDAHHRRLKGMGGTSREDTDLPGNLLALDPEVHNGAPWSVHQRTSWSRPRGYLLSTSVEIAAEEPLLYRGKTWMILDDEGSMGELTARSQRHLWFTRIERLQLAPAARARGSQYR